MTRSGAERRAAPTEIIPLELLEETVGPAADREAEIRILARAFARIDKIALGIATGAVCGGAVFLATAWLLVKGGHVVGPYLSLLGQFFPAYEVTWPGAFIGLAYGFAIGFGLGWGVALLKNIEVALFLRHARVESERSARRRFLEYM